jgi:hypothetical protein
VANPEGKEKRSRKREEEGSNRKMKTKEKVRKEHTTKKWNQKVKKKEIKQNTKRKCRVLCAVYLGRYRWLEGNMIGQLRPVRNSWSFHGLVLGHRGTLALACLRNGKE